MTALETRLDTILPMLATKADMAEVRADVSKAAAETHKGFSDMVKWIVGMSFAMMAVLISAGSLYFGHIAEKPQQQTSALPPIIINVPGVQQASDRQPAPADNKSPYKNKFQK